MINIAVDTAKMEKLKAKFEKYGPYATRAGLKASNDFLNTPSLKMSMYPPSQSGSPFVWSSDRQRRAFFATNGFGRGIPTVRTFGLANAGQFTVNESSFWIEYQNAMPGAKFVIHPSYQIIGHRQRGWPPINQFVSRQSSRVVSIFKPAAINAWEEMDAFIMGGGGGL